METRPETLLEDDCLNILLTVEKRVSERYQERIANKL
jgi:hypothetical protein